MNYTVADWRLGTDPNLIKLMRNFPQALRQTGFQRLFSVCLCFLIPQLVIFLLLKRDLKRDVQQNLSVTLSVFARKGGKKSVFTLFGIAPFHQISDVYFPVGAVFILLWNKRVISAFSFKGRQYFGFLSFWYWISDLNSLIPTSSGCQNLFLVSSWAQSQGHVSSGTLSLWISSVSD